MRATTDIYETRNDKLTYEKYSSRSRSPDFLLSGETAKSVSM